MTRASTLPPSGTVGLLGGAFDPPHYGHLMVAREALAQLALCKLFVVVTRAAPHKEVETDAAIRLGLAEIAFSGLDAVEVSRTELDRPGPSYTVDTVRWSRRRYGETTFVIGADEFADFLEWHEPEGGSRCGSSRCRNPPWFSSRQSRAGADATARGRACALLFDSRAPDLIPRDSGTRVAGSQDQRARAVRCRGRDPTASALPQPA